MRGKVHPDTESDTYFNLDTDRHPSRTPTETSIIIDVTGIRQIIVQKVR
jgi:hypothetical protein